MTSSDDKEFKSAVRAVFAEEAQKAFDLGWNTAVVTISESIARMTALGDTAASFAAFIKEFHRDMAFPTAPTTDTEEQQPTEVQPEQP